MFNGCIRGQLCYAAKPNALTVQENAVLLVQNGVLQNILPRLPDGYEGEVHDYANALLLPGFLDMHLHAPQYPMRGIGLELELLDWLNQYTFPTESQFEDTSYARKVYGALAKELVEMGTTRVCMYASLHYESTLVLMEELEKAGVCGYVGKVNMDRNAPDILCEKTEDSIASTVRFLEYCEAHFKKVKPILTPRFIPSCTPPLLSALGKLAKERDLPLQSHLSENRGEIAWVKELEPDCKSYGEAYDKYGMMYEKSLMAHCVYSDKAERALMKNRGTRVVHCPESNTNLSSGIAPVRAMLREGVKVCLGSDIAGGNDLSMLGIMGAAVSASKLYRALVNEEDTALSPAEALHLATNADFFGENTCFEIGKPLHCVAVSDEALPHLRPLRVEERLERMMHLPKARAVQAVYAEGEKIR